MDPKLQYYLPQQLLSNLMGALSNSTIVWLKNFLISQFMQRYPVDLSQAIVEKQQDYPSFNAFFTRQLKPQLRSITTEPTAFASPCDGTIYQIGELSNTTITAKQHAFTINALLGPNIDHTIFNKGNFINIYLAPIDYHRIHMPLTGTLEQMTYIPGKLFSVNNNTAATIPNLFAKNERVVLLFNTEFGKMAVIMIGAMLVGSIHTSWASCINPGHSMQSTTVHYQPPQNPTFKIGAELGHFAMGSTVIVLLQQAINWEPQITANTKLCYGTAIGRMLV